jgi:hypothetical protein
MVSSPRFLAAADLGPLVVPITAPDTRFSTKKAPLPASNRTVSALWALPYHPVCPKAS